jgi:dUTP pyrophosphatase
MIEGIPKIMPLYQDSILPSKKYEGDAGFDVYAHEDKLIMANSWYKFRLGFAIELPKGTVAIISERSGMAAKDGIMTIGNIIDSTYRGECHAILYNGSWLKSCQIKKGDRIAQMIIMPCYTSGLCEVTNKLSASVRDTGGFGSTGK